MRTRGFRVARGGLSSLWDRLRLRLKVVQVICFLLPRRINAADTIVVGRFAGNEALAAVGSVGSLKNMVRYG